jgi:ATP-binding cassette subfamily F protein 3
MPLLTATKLSLSYGAVELFSNIDLVMEAKDKIGLVGPNGVGKTTLLLILAGVQEATAGVVQRSEGLTLGYLHQEAVLTFAGQENSVYEEMLAVFSKVREQEARLRSMEADMAARQPSPEFMEAYGALQYAFELEGGYEYQNEIKRVLLGLAFPQDEWDTPLSHLSGGQKTRLLLGRLLLEKPELLILDEPSNHLDTASVEWLEATLRTYEGSFIIVSHDRYLLDNVVNRVWIMEQGAIISYRGNYSSSVRQRKEEWEREQQLFISEIERLGKEVAFIRKHIAGGKSDIAKGKLKRITRDILLLERAGETGSLGELKSKSWLEIGGRGRSLSLNQAAKRVAGLKAPADGPPALNIKLEAHERSGRIVLRSSELSIGFTQPLFTTGRIRLERLERVAMLGPNGSGKSTFLRTLMGQIRPLGGWLKYGDGIRLGYFAQGHDQLNMDHRVVDALMDGSNLEEKDARTVAARYLFRGDDAFKQVGDLSGGERGRLALAKLAQTGPNLLLLDEPTNHLDIPSQELLQSVLESFDGTILLVSHDRYLVDRLATRIWELKDGKLEQFEGTFREYIAHEHQRQTELELGQEEPAAPVDLDWVEALEPVPVGRGAQRERRRRIAKLRAELDDAEEWLARVELEIEEALEAGDEEALGQLRDESVVLQARWESLTSELGVLLG